MATQTFGLSAGRLNKFKGEILAHAVPQEVLGKAGRQVKFPKNNSDTYVARRWIPYGASAAAPNVFFANAAGDRGLALTAAHQTQEGVTATPDTITPQDVTVVMVQYSCLYSFTDKTYDLYEDDVPEAMREQVGERVTLVNENIIYGVVKAGTNQFYGGTGTTRATVNGTISLGMLRKMAKSLLANHGKVVNRVLSASPNYGTDSVGEGFTVYLHTDLEPDIRDLPGFVPSEKYASGKPMPNEIGKCERFRFITSPDLPSIQSAATSTTAATYNLYSTNSDYPDVYCFIVTAQDAWSQVAVRGVDSVDPTFLPPGQKTKSDPLGQRGYAGAIWWKAAMIENQGWMAVGQVGVKVLV